MDDNLRADFERLNRDSQGFARSRKGTYKNPSIARDWKWFELGHIAASHNEVVDQGLISAACAVLDMCEQHGDFRNGVTDPTGSIDEGDVIASRYFETLRTAIAKAGNSK